MNGISVRYNQKKAMVINPPRKILLFSEDHILQTIMAKICSRYFGGEVYLGRDLNDLANFGYLGGFDLAIIDMNLSEPTASALVKGMQQEQPSLPIIAIVGGDDREVDELKRLGVSEIAYQPIRIAAFLEIAAGALIDKQHINMQ